MRHQPQANQLSLPEKLLTIMFLVGVFVIVGSIVSICVLFEINHDWLVASVSDLIAPLIVGVVVVFVSVKLLEIMK